MAPRALGPRATIRARASTAVSRSASPTASAASIQPRKPMPVVTTTMSGGSSSSSRVAAMSRASSSLGTMLSAGACRIDRAAALQGGAELGGAAVRGHEDHAPRHGLRDGLAHGAIVSRARGTDGTVSRRPAVAGASSSGRGHVRRRR